MGSPRNEFIIDDSQNLQNSEDEGAVGGQEL